MDGERKEERERSEESEGREIKESRDEHTCYSLINFSAII